MILARIGKVRFQSTEDLFGYLKGRLDATHEPYIEEQLEYALAHRQEKFTFAGFRTIGKDKADDKTHFVKTTFEYV